MDIVYHIYLVSQNQKWIGTIMEGNRILYETKEAAGYLDSAGAVIEQARKDGKVYDHYKIHQ